MREHPILFSGRLVRAILEGRKTQTRRVIRDAPVLDHTAFARPAYVTRRAVRHGGRVTGHREVIVPCPYGYPGDRLWVREAFCPTPDDPDGVPALYRCDVQVPGGYPYKSLDPIWKPSIHMPRALSRIALEVTGVRVERLQEISEEDAIAEGVVFVDHGRNAYGTQNPGWHCDPSEAAKGPDHCLGTARFAFANAWDSINGKRPGASWADNPWVWELEFRRLDQEVRRVG